MNGKINEYMARRLMERNRQENESRYENSNAEPQHSEYNRSEDYRRSPNSRMSNSRGAEYHKPPEEREKRRIGFSMSKGSAKSNKDFVYTMEESLEREVDDVVYYCELCEEAFEKGHEEFAKGFYQVAKEKLTCAEYIRYSLKKMDLYATSEQEGIEEMYQRAKELFDRI